MIQFLILMLGALTITLMASKDYRKQGVGCACGLLCEPLWIYEAWTTDQWGVVILAVWWFVWYGIALYRRLNCFFTTPHSPSLPGTCIKEKNK